MKNFSTTTFGKWIFSGEHSVLRGGPALVFPLFNKSFKLTYEMNHLMCGIEYHFSGVQSNDLELFFPGLIKKAIHRAGIKESQLKGNLWLHNEIPLGSGLGASSSLCVAVSRWFTDMGFVPSDHILEFARELENIFHGESSGVDIAVVLHEKPLIYKRPNQIEFLQVKNDLNLFLTHSGQKGITRDCVEKVQKLHLNFPELAQEIDKKMIDSTNKAIQLYKSGDQSSHVSEFVEVINQAGECFYQWGLVDNSIDHEIKNLRSAGALAVKLTGSGGGGYILSLFPRGHQLSHGLLQKALALSY